MRITVEYLAQLRPAAGCAAEEVDFAGTTLRDLLTRLGQRPGLRPLLLDDRGEVHRALLLFIGEQQADANQPLRDGDRVTILAPMAGG